MVKQSWEKGKGEWVAWPRGECIGRGEGPLIGPRQVVGKFVTDKVGDAKVVKAASSHPFQLGLRHPKIRCHPATIFSWQSRSPIWKHANFGRHGQRQNFWPKDNFERPAVV